MATTRFKADRFIKELRAKEDELLSHIDIDKDDVKISIHVTIEEQVRYCSTGGDA